MKESGHLRAKQRFVEGKIRRTYLITAKGRRALAATKDKVKELFEED